MFALRLLFREQLKCEQRRSGRCKSQSGGGSGKHLNSVFTKLCVKSKRSSLINTDLCIKHSSLPLKSAEGDEVQMLAVKGRHIAAC